MIGKIRQAKKEDFAFIFDSWSKSSKKSTLNAKMSKKLFNERLENLILELLKNGARITLMVDPDDEDFIFAWVCTGTLGNLPVVYYAFSKLTFRQHGFCKTLLAANSIDGINTYIYCNRTSIIDVLDKKSSTLKAGTYDPYVQFL